MLHNVWICKVTAFLIFKQTKYRFDKSFMNNIMEIMS
jgi:hypothetical protein